MRICVFGAGAVGSHLALRLARAGNEVCCVMRGPHLAAVRKHGLTLRAVIAKERIVGGVIFSSNEVIAPGVVENLSPERNMLLIGECDDREGERIARLRSVLEAAQFASAAVARIRETIWSKLLTNMSMSVMCLLTGQTARAVRDDAALTD